MRTYYVPRRKGELVLWLKERYPGTGWGSMRKERLYAVYFRLMEAWRR